MYRPTLPFLAFIAIVAAIGATAALADDTITFQHPTQYTDNSALNAADIQATIIRQFNSVSDTTVRATHRVERGAADSPDLPPPTRIVIPRPTVVTVATTQCYDAATLMKVSAGGGQSNFAPADPICKTINPPPAKKPRPPKQTAVAALIEDSYGYMRWYGETHSPVVILVGG